jgi:hypothetical protein
MTHQCFPTPIDSMTQWMEYVCMQQPKPTNTTGVPIRLSVVDSNGNFRTIGTTTSSDDGYYSYAWVPEISGHTESTLHLTAANHIGPHKR